MRQISKKEAILIGENKLYEDWSYEEKVKFQLFQDFLAMPIDVFHKALQEVLKRKVFSHEIVFNLEGLKKEFLGVNPSPTFEEIISLIPKEKLIII